MQLSLNDTKTPLLSENEVVINNQSQLAFFKDELFDTIIIEGQVDFESIVQIGRILKIDGILKWNTDKQQQLILAGLIQISENTFQKKNLSHQHLGKPINAYGKYDYIVQSFINNPFEQFQKIKQQEQIDEDELLNDDVQVKQVESCASKPRPCANCTCGRKELEDKQDQEVLISQLANGQVESSCGSCYLGDAFRCANCPYRGLPAFKEGEQVKVSNQLQNVEEVVEQPEIKNENGVVKLQI